jgi:hypothetical protein
MKCDVCDEEFETENQLMQHKAQMHAGESGSGMEPVQDPKVDAREGMMPMPEGAEMNEDDSEESDYPKAANQ